ncbi:MAG: hypothetical protein M3020_23785 [Myxococcota bacterium]|nr:hypothetical protein [Myxococcota bacterium]
MHIADGIRAEPEGYWVEPHWLAIASDGAGQHIMIDDHDGRVLAVAHDDEHVGVLAASPEAWLTKLLDEHAAGAVVWQETFGLIGKKELAKLREAQRARAQRAHARPDPPLKQKLAWALGVVLAMAGVTLFGWFFASRR